MQKIMFNETYGLQQAVFDELKLMTRREPYFGEISKPNSGFYVEGKDKGRLALCDGERVVRKSRYRIGEVVAVAQAYKDIPKYNFLNTTAGWLNKMFVRPDLMPIKIRITDVKVERLQDISDEDCLKEGIEKDYAEGSALFWCSVPHKGISWEEYKKRNYELSRHELNGENGSYFWDTPQGAFSVLIDKISGKGTWEANPWVYAYSFELIK